MTQVEHRNRWRVMMWCVAGLATVALVSGALTGCMPDIATPTPTPTRTPLFAATALPTDLPQPTMTPIGAALAATDPGPATTATPEALPENTNPLTGEVMADSSVLERIPVAIKIDNYPPAQVWPQNGLNSADLVYEHYNEGWFSTRFTAIYLGQDPEKVGSVRSGRLIDMELPAMYKAAFACSGFSNGVLALMQDSDLYPDQIASESLPATLSPSPLTCIPTRRGCGPGRMRTASAGGRICGG
jgi:hypothetical protein